MIEKSGNSISNLINDQSINITWKRKIVHPVIILTAVGRKSGTTNLTVLENRKKT